MMELPLDFAVPQVISFMLVVARLSGFFLIAPVFSSPMLPPRVKIMILLVLSATLTPIVGGPNPVVPTDTIGLVIGMGTELLVGLALGFSVSLVFTSVQVGASMIDTSIGFSMANIIDPLNNVQASVLGSFYSMVATLTFLAVNGHHWLLAGFKRSYATIPMAAMPDIEQMLSNLFATFTQLFAMAFQIAAPVLVTLLLIDVVLGMVARVVPQMNVFFVGIPLKIGVGLVAVIIALPTFTSFIEHRVSDVIAGAGVLAGTGENAPSSTVATTATAASIQPGEVRASDG